MANGTHVDELTPATPADLADTDLVYVGLVGDADPDRKMTLSNLRGYLDDYFALLTGATFSGGLILPGGPDVTLASTGNPLQIGGAGGENIAIDANEIQARNNGAAAILNLQAAGGDAHIGGAAVAGYDSNANGEYVRFYNGVQICWTVQTLTYSSALELNKVWTFPIAFDANPRVVAIPANTGSNISDAERSGSFLFVASVGTTSITLRMRSNSLYGGGNESHDVYAIAIGTWS